jgi:pectate lyase
MLLGRDDGDMAQDTGRPRVTYHHNWFDATTQRNPRMRFGDPVHVYNNYYNDTDNYGVASTMNGGVLVERNYFENVEDPTTLVRGVLPTAAWSPWTTVWSTPGRARPVAAWPQSPIPTGPTRRAV